MLGFFRKYQKYFYVVITIVIVISFSFFGTYSSMDSAGFKDPVVFTAVDGAQVTRSELEEMVVFLGTDNDDKLLFGGAWGPNFLNDGVIKKDILQAGLAQSIVEQYKKGIETDLQQRVSREKRYTPYVHSQANFINADAVWGYVAPDIKSNLQKLRETTDPVSEEAFDARVQLFLAERRFPAPALRQVLKYQEKQYPWVSEDPIMDRTDLSLFGYHTTDDWFGPRFMRLAAQFVINSAKIAEQKGYVVTKEEALADLIENSQTSFQQNLQNPNLGVANHSEYFSEQLRRLGMDQKRAVKVWQQVLLFRRLFQDVGNSVVVSPFSYQKFADYANEYASGDLYQVPESLRLGTFQDLQKFEMYLKAVTNSSQDSLVIPTQYKPVSEVKSSYPELVQRRYELEIRESSKQLLQTRVGVKETWEWQTQDENWAKLKKEFPDLGIEKGDTRDERFAALDRLSPKTRARVDAFARKAIVDKNPEWLVSALKNATPRQMNIGIGKRGGKMPIKGLDDREALIQLLDNAPLGEDPVGELSHFTGDQENFYSIKLIEKGGEPQILTFAQAKEEGVLDEVLKRILEAYYIDIRKEHSSDFQHADRTWKEFAIAKDKVAEYYFADTLSAVRKAKENAKLTPDLAASYRFVPHMERIQKEVMANPDTVSEWIAQDDSLQDQWKLVTSETRIERSMANEESMELFAMKEGDWSDVLDSPNGDVSFFYVKKKGADSDLESVGDEVMALHRMMSSDAQQVLLLDVMREIVDKEAINLDYLNPKEEG